MEAKLSRREPPQKDDSVAEKLSEKNNWGLEDEEHTQSKRIYICWHATCVTSLVDSSCNRATGW